MEKEYYRLNLSKQEFEILESYVSTIIDEIEDQDGDYINDHIEDIAILKNILNHVKQIKVSDKKLSAPKKANNTKISKSREKIKKAYDKLKSENKKITIYSIAKEADVAHQTAKKHMDIFK